MPLMMWHPSKLHSSKVADLAHGDVVTEVMLMWQMTILPSKAKIFLLMSLFG